MVTDPIPFNGDFIGITGFGLINHFSHVILKKNTKTNQLNEDKNHLPTLIIASGRNEANVKEVLTKVIP